MPGRASKVMTATYSWCKKYDTASEPRRGHNYDQRNSNGISTSNASEMNPPSTHKRLIPLGPLQLTFPSHLILIAVAITCHNYFQPEDLPSRAGIQAGKRYNGTTFQAPSPTIQKYHLATHPRVQRRKVLPLILHGEQRLLLSERRSL